MAADTAETVGSMNVRGLVEDRAFFGLTKLLPIRKLQAGISYWGWAKMPPSSNNGVWMDWWLRAFLAENTGNYTAISDLAELLQKELQKVVSPLSKTEFELMPYGNGGIHRARGISLKLLLRKILDASISVRLSFLCWGTFLRP